MAPSDQSLAFGRILKRYRTTIGLTQLDLEVRTGINEGKISKIKNGKNLDFTTLVELAKGLGIPVANLLAKFSY